MKEGCYTKTNESTLLFLTLPIDICQYEKPKGLCFVTRDRN